MTKFITTLSQRVRCCFPDLSSKEKCALAIMLFTTFQAVVRQPYIIIAGERHVNLFGGLICILSLVAAWLFSDKKRVHAGKGEIGISLGLSVLAIASGLTSPTPQHSLMRVFVLLAPALGGYWSARLLLRSRISRAHFTLFCSGLFGIFITLQIIGYLGYGSVHHFFDEFRHPQVSVALLLSFAPLTLLLSKQRPQRTIGLALICICFCIFFLSGLRSAVFMPIAVTAVALLFGFVPLRWFLVIAAVFILIGASYFALFPEKRMKLSGEPAYYRLENYPFSWYIATQHPLLGAGLRVKREGYLEHYQIHYPHVTKEKFAWTLKRIRVSENIFLTFASSLGFPFVLLFATALAALYLKLFSMLRNAVHQVHGGLARPHPIVLFIPLTAGLLHFQVYDGLLHPQVCWLYFLLLGLLHQPNDPKESRL